MVFKPQTEAESTSLHRLIAAIFTELCVERASKQAAKQTKRQFLRYCTCMQQSTTLPSFTDRYTLQPSARFDSNGWKKPLHTSRKSRHRASCSHQRLKRPVPLRLTWNSRKMLFFLCARALRNSVNNTSNSSNIACNAIGCRSKNKKS